MCVWAHQKLDEIQLHIIKLNTKDNKTGMDYLWKYFFGFYEVKSIFGTNKHSYSE